MQPQIDIHDRGGTRVSVHREQIDENNSANHLTGFRLGGWFRLE